MTSSGDDKLFMLQHLVRWPINSNGRLTMIELQGHIEGHSEFERAKTLLAAVECNANNVCVLWTLSCSQRPWRASPPARLIQQVNSSPGPRAV
ncbi:hypothetical protein RRG08_047934 [Elysia crispata]|uniref:Uncharacterized protein n=1 Tax=Elysia crispata TaxID=231223 RepID=A0AAE0ZLI9_9GAST|nr:hypothetical protein RRG08_047934 [Elysia crispata]